jgi:hypothetical protein
VPARTLAAGSVQVWRAAGRVSPLNKGSEGSRRPAKPLFLYNPNVTYAKAFVRSAHADRAFNQ